MRLVPIVPKISHIDNETIKSRPLEYLCRCVVAFFFFVAVFMLIHVSEEHLESEPPTSLCSRFGKLEEILQR